MAFKNENLEINKSPETSHEKVSPTARGIAYRRAICDIPFAKDVYDELAKVMTPLLLIFSPVSAAAAGAVANSRFNVAEGDVVLLPAGSACQWKT